MVKQIYELHADMCKVFTSSVRVEIIEILQDGKKSVSELVELTGLSQSNISQHLQIMKEKGVLTPEKKGNHVFYSLSNPKIAEAFRIMREILLSKMADSEKLYKAIKKIE